MATVNILQNLNVHSVANAPASTTINCSATTPGTLLLWIVTATSSGSPVISSPGGSWVSVYNTSVSNLAYALYVQLNNAGGITTITSNLATTTAGGVCSGFLEIQAVTPNSNQLWSNDFSTSYNQIGTTVPWTGITSYTSIAELLFYCSHRAASTYTPNNTFHWNGGYGSGVSTGSTTNAQQDIYLGITIEELGQASGGGSLGTSVANALGYARYNSSISFPFNYTSSPVGGKSGVMQPQFFQGMIGG